MHAKESQNNDPWGQRYNQQGYDQGIRKVYQLPSNNLHERISVTVLFVEKSHFSIPIKSYEIFGGYPRDRG
jgi:hypothetical protein